MPKKKQLEVSVKPSVINWAIQSSGWKISEISSKIAVSEENINKWVLGEKKPTIRQLEKLAYNLRRPLAAFFLPEPPEDKRLPEDFRMPSEKTAAFSKDVLLAMRRARRLQLLSKGLFVNLNYGINPITKSVALTDNPIIIASNERLSSNIGYDIQSKWKSPHKAFKAWREYIESMNILVLQIKMPPEEVRGFSLIDEEPYVIVVSSNDNPFARVFTLMHEFAHILLKTQGICKPEELFSENKNYPEIEKWCDCFAGSFLMPKELFEKDISEIPTNNLTNTEVITNLTNKYSVSKAAVLTKMKILGKISQNEYAAKLGLYSKEEKKLAPKKGIKATKPMKLSLEKQCIRDKGNKFVSVVIDNVRRGYITNNDALDYLSIKMKNWDKLTQVPKQTKNEPA